MFEQADRVILNCETTLATYRELYPQLPVERLTAIHGEETLYIPAKLYDYLLARAPIACLAPPACVDCLLGQHAHARDVARRDRAAGLAGLNDRRELLGERAFVPDEAVLERYCARTSAGELARQLDAIAG